MIKKSLPAPPAGRYAFPAGVNPPAGRCNPISTKAITDAPSVFFIVVISAHLCTAAYCRPVSMVALVGQPKGWPVSFVPGIATPISVTANHERCNSGGDSLNTKETAIMATTPTPSHPEFTFHFLAVRRSDLSDTPHRESVTAPDEATARRLLAGRFILCFAGRVPAQGVRHV